MKRCLSLFLGILLLLPSGLLQAQEGLSSFEQDLLNELNDLRAHPKKYRKILEELLPHFEGKLLKMPGEAPLMTREGEKAVKETIKFLKKVDSLPPLQLADPLVKSAQEHAQDQGPKGTRGHTGSDGSAPADRVSRYGVWKSRVGEAISYGRESARLALLQLLIDDGVKDRGHRKILFNPIYSEAGLACGTHKTYHSFCVLDFADGFVAPADLELAPSFPVR